MPVNCPQCHAAALPGANFCEECGAKLPAEKAAGEQAVATAGAGLATQVCANCGAGPESVDSEGFCSQCGHERRPPSRDHVEEAAGAGLAAVSDRGVKHFRNEDAFALGEAAGWTVVAICDGVSNSPRADEASAAGVAAIRDTLAEGLKAGEADLAGLMTAALARAQAAVGALAGRHEAAGAGSAGDLPASTAVAALARVETREVVLGWIGDSRAYFVDRHGGARLLTKDHSLVNELVDAGKMTRSEALRSRQAHTVTRTLGGALAADGRPDVASVAQVTLPEAGWLLLCTDGLWNYAPEPPELAAMAARSGAKDGEALALCRTLVAEALRLGGRDNVTVAVSRMTNDE